MPTILFTHLVTPPPLIDSCKGNGKVDFIWFEHAVVFASRSDQEIIILLFRIVLSIYFFFFSLVRLGLWTRVSGLLWFLILDYVLVR